MKRQFKKTASLVFSLLLLSLMVACAIGSHKQTSQKQEKDCESMEDENSKLNCYFAEIRNSIYLEMISAVRDWAKYDSENSQSSPQRGLTVVVELYENGAVKNVTLIRRSESSSFNEAIEEAIYRAGPFLLPKDNNLKKRLLKFSYSIVL